MSSEQIVYKLKEELETLQKKCEQLKQENLTKEETIRKLTGQLQTAQTFGNTWDRVVDMTLEGLARRRGQALERYRVEYESRMKETEAVDKKQEEGEDYDEIDF